MKYLMMVALVAAMFVPAMANAEEIKSGLQAGERIGAFYVTKTAGAEDDGVKVGANLCYRCKNGSRPQVMVFTRSANDKVVELVKSLDSQLAKNESKQLRAFVNVLAEDKTEASENAKSLAKSSAAKHVPFVVPNEVENGPDDYGISAKAEVTIILASGGQVKASRGFSKGEEVDVEAVIADLSKILE